MFINEEREHSTGLVITLAFVVTIFDCLFAAAFAFATAEIFGYFGALIMALPMLFQLSYKPILLFIVNKAKRPESFRILLCSIGMTALLNSGCFGAFLLADMLGANFGG